jgi:hypothetical protein
MSASQPPRFATWLLERFGVQESIAGDLVERYPAKRSSAWFWRQVLATIGAGAARDIRGHKLLAVRAVVAGFALLSVFGSWTRILLNNAHGALWINGHWVQPGRWLRLVSVLYIWVALAGALSGWSVAYLHRAHRASMTIVFAGCFLLWQLVQLPVLLTMNPPPTGFQVADFGIITLIIVLSIMLGGLWGDRARKKALPRSSRT